MPTIFFSYSHEDEELRNRLEKHLSLLKRQGFVDAWHDRRILAGATLDQAISGELERAEIVLLLVSADFLASEYCYSKEMMRAMERHHAGSTIVIPVIVKPCDWHSAPFGGLLATPRDGKAVTTWANVEEALADVASYVRKRVEAMCGAAQAGASGATARTAAPPVAVPASAVRPSVARSSNLRLKKEFTDHDRDIFLHESFEFLSHFFENSLVELQQRNPDVQAIFRRVDSDSFLAVVYRDGKTAAQCAIRLSGLGGGGITYSSDASPRGSSFNEWLSVESDDQAMFLRANMGMAFGASAVAERMTLEAAADHFWSVLMQPLQ